MIHLHLILTLVCCMHTLSSAAEKQTFRALSFGKTTEDYIQFTPADMSPFQSSLTGCAWIKRQNEARYPMILHFHDPFDEIIMGSNGYWNNVNRQSLRLTGRFPQKNAWFHYCLSWSAGGEQKVYINGEELGSRSALSRNLTMTGEICLGNREQTPKDSNYIFGSQLFKLNLFSEVLSSSDIRQMSAAGMCSSIEMKHESRRLTWERILTEPRYGHVTEFVPEECFQNFMAKLDDSTSQLREIQEYLLDRDMKLNRTDEKLQRVMKNLNTTVDTLEETRTQLNNSLEQLKESESALFKSRGTHNSTKQKLSEISETLNDTRSELAHTKIQLGEAQNEVREREARLNRTDDQLQQVMTTLNSTVDTLEETRTQLNNSLEQLKEAKNEIKEKEKTLNDTHVELTGTQTKLREVEGALKVCDARLNESLSRQEACDARLNESLFRQEACDARLNESLSRQMEINAQLNESLSLQEARDSRLNESISRQEACDARLNESLSRQEACDARLNESLSRQEQCDAQLNESLSRHEEGRNLGEVSRWDVLYTSPYLNKLFTRQLYQLLIGSWGMMGKSFL